ncbi:MAG: TatD family hydrolase [Acidobacteriota bacterium]
MVMKLVDIGVNLAHASFNSDREEVINRAIAAGVDIMIVTGTSIKGSREAFKLADNYPGKLYSTAGIHPHDARHFNIEAVKILRELAAHKNVVAIGECGLDFNRDFSPRDIQEKCFEAQVQLASQLRMPLFLHERDAHQRFVEILKRYRDQFNSAVVHCFTGSAQELNAYLDLNLHIGITGWICDERRGLHLRDLVRRIPLDRLLIETDAPFLIPRDLKPKPKTNRNEPSLLPHILNTVARCMGKTSAEVAIATTEAAHTFFGIKDRNTFNKAGNDA